jgi:NADH-quinone oxidoreductase subunit A
LYPWVIGIARLPVHAFFTITIFFGVLFIGYGYEWLKGTLNWAESSEVDFNKNV